MSPSSGAGSKRKRHMAETSASKRFKSTFENVVTILVGSDEQRFMAHEDLICNRSTFFKAACSKSWKENQEKVIRLSDGDPTTLRIYLERIYDDSTSLLECVDRRAKEVDGRRGRGSRRGELLCALWMLGDFLLDIALIHEAMDALCTESHSGRLALTSKSVSEIFEHTRDECGLRRWLVDFIVARMSKEKCARMIDKLPNKLVYTVLMRLLPDAEQLKPKTPFPSKDKSYYHDRPGGEEESE